MPGEDDEHRGQGPLHVVGATTDQAVTFYASIELLDMTGDDVDVPVEDDAALAGADLGKG